MIGCCRDLGVHGHLTAVVTGQGSAEFFGAVRHSDAHGRGDDVLVGQLEPPRLVGAFDQDPNREPAVGASAERAGSYQTF
jgi:hypothetical protein